MTTSLTQSGEQLKKWHDKENYTKLNNSETTHIAVETLNGQILNWIKTIWFEKIDVFNENPSDHC